MFFKEREESKVRTKMIGQRASSMTTSLTAKESFPLLAITPHIQKALSKIIFLMANARRHLKLIKTMASTNTRQEMS